MLGREVGRRRTGTPADPAPTPLRRQYLDIKRQHTDAIVMFRLGDFYEMFERDAEVAAAVLRIVLTTREFGRGTRVPMCGVPYHAAHAYIARLIEAGHRVAVCDQLSEPGRGLVDRRVTRVITPGTVVDEAMLRPEANNYLAVVVHGAERVGFAYADVTTGEFAATEVDPAALERERGRVAPRETLTIGDPSLPAAGAMPARRWMADAGVCQEALRRHLRVGSLEGLGLHDRPVAAHAAGALLTYLEDTDPAALHVLTQVHAYSVATFMELDPFTRANLELESAGRAGRTEGSLLAVLDRTRTPMGARLLRRRLGRPALERADLERRLDCVAAFVAASELRATLRDLLGQVGDLERLA
ncbi:MAG: DNA mismatch repair protein MutS, partial [Actinobacteria bacterium]|nr:DNA mismatch repair protein MutS [Actinomycetota bacterium]